ncbi:metal-dependent hydrolase [Brevibacillus composti]|uniref:Metal-dependent hydrolase n=1 Tax=Brevibacillus composti TaxID=2796470 RepID=A0A7T5EJC0_9BACL|nr:metal-dependent hydrolase [Brevibacillus composti]QQE73675.1 metal-dependent hydrolase [Brevibacillus composti]QUO40758.1 metal-dependent hydrolase [Brevibacillus composti]
MDTGSHLLLGVTLGGLAHLSPGVAGDPALAQAVMIAAVVGSHAPDFDTVVRVRGATAYIRYHRGVTHSIPALFLWPGVIALAVAAGCGVWEQLGVLYLWSFAAVVFHVFLDMLNTYGVQCLRPFSRRWVHLDILAIFEPFLFVLHAAAVVWWLFFGGKPGTICAAAYLLSAGYIGLRACQHQWLIRQVQRQLGVAGICHVIPSFHPFLWRFVVETDRQFYTGKVEYGRVCLEDLYQKERESDIIRATMGVDGVRAFLGFAQRIHVTCKELQDGYEVIWSDVRFWYDSQLPFGVDVRLDRKLNVVSLKLGWRKKAWSPPFV